ncbi:MAG: bifunctional phosphopantothenoylcysteine decarboxylase/phosphopantothenate--cysteine ligase CoaBC [Pseudobdellovibrionaceae bacterium]|jgi:phosphopantothenoylcysteine decarboxylase/phosphopantothenate--cysteine ligase
MSKSKVLVLMSGSIAAYKACSLISKLVQNNYEVQVAASSSALQFVGAATLEGLTGRPILTDNFQSGHMMSHIHAIRWADLVIAVPATAHLINRMAQGIGDDLLTTLFLAHDFKKPFLIAPAMNTTMYLHPTTQKSLSTLKSWSLEILETASGVLACGEVGWGKLLDPELIFAEIQSRRTAQPSATEVPVRIQTASRVLITSGGTQEPIDQVRVLSNKSTGSTGALLAETLCNLGMDVTFVTSAQGKRPQSQMKTLEFETFKDLEKNLKSELQTESYDFVIHAAAVSDFSIEKIEVAGQSLDQGQKVSSEQDVTLKLRRNPKLITEIRYWSKNPRMKLIGFKMTATQDQTQWQKAVEKVFLNSQPDLVVHNDMSEMNWKTGQHVFHIYQNSQKAPVDCTSKEDFCLKLSRWIGNGDFL